MVINWDRLNFSITKYLFASSWKTPPDDVTRRSSATWLNYKLFFWFFVSCTIWCQENDGIKWWSGNCQWPEKWSSMTQVIFNLLFPTVKISLDWNQLYLFRSSVHLPIILHCLIHLGTLVKYCVISYGSWEAKLI